MLPSVRAVTLTGYSEVASDLGLDPYLMLREAKITLEMFTDAERRIPARSVCELLERSAQASLCATFGLRMAQCRTFASLGPLALLLEQLGNIRSVVDSLTAYRRHLNDIVILGFDDAEDQILRIELLAKFATPQAADLALGVAYNALRGASRCRWEPLEVHFVHGPSEPSRYEMLFGCSVNFRSSFNGFLFAPSSFATEWPWANETMAGHARRLLALVPIAPEVSRVSDSLARAIALLLPTGRATLPHVAANLQISPRSLQRQLSAEGRRFSELLNEVRRAVAINYLRTGACTITAIAEHSGYYSSSAFARWFTSEFGIAPSRWRALESSAAVSNLI